MLHFEHFSFLVWQIRIFDFRLDLNLNCDLDQVKISNIKCDDMAPLTGDYCSMTLGVLQISSTTRNLVPRFKGWSKGKRLGKDGAQHKIVTLGLSQ